MSPWANRIPRCIPIVLMAAVSTLAQDRAFINRYCVACHNTKVKTSGLALDSMLAEGISQHPDKWERVVRKLRARYMPPPGTPRPDERTYESVVSSLEASLDAAGAAKLNPGRTDTFRRLNRTE